jgi:hypothetical protein
MISEAFTLGGWGMYPVLVLGALMLGSAIWYAMNPERKRLLVPFVLAFVTFCAGTLGFLTGVMVSISHAAETSTMMKFVALGAAEALNCLTFALAWNVLAGLVVAVGAFRATRQTPNAEQAPALAEARS